MLSANPEDFHEKACPCHLSARARRHRPPLPIRSPIARRVMKENGKHVGVLVKMVKGEKPIRRRGRSGRSDSAQRQRAEDRRRRVCSRPEATRATPPPRRRSGKTWPGSRPRWTSSRPITAAAVAAPAQDLEALEARSSARSAQICGGCHETYPHQEGLSPVDGLCWESSPSPRSSLGGVGAAAFWFLTAPTAARRRDARRARDRRCGARRADFLGRRLHVLPCAAEIRRARRSLNLPAASS